MPTPDCPLPIASVRFPCLDAVAHGGNPQDRAASLGELNSPRVAPLPTPSVPLTRN
ncbi:hypothetical protein [Moorena sp. SIO4G3]|uniref:hypothetical protein n=1 Tax=Moorena sp. SIO4G3 TaxID=2607821 RepID=UPI0025D641E2|nr:hypothetical protein [Moorena sp. SIO4G3]